jgi:hypothetical protein
LIVFRHVCKLGFEGIVSNRAETIADEQAHALPDFPARDHYEWRDSRAGKHPHSPFLTMQPPSSS